MSVPAWKQAILERKRQQEEVEKKKQLQKEQYYASLPPWKRAMLKKKGSTSDLNEEHPPCPLIKPKNDLIPAWKQAFRSRKDSFEKEKQIQNEVENDRIPAWKQAVRSRKESFEKEKQVQNEVENGDHIPAWKQAVRSRKQSFEKEKQVQNEVENGDHIPAWKQAVRSRKQSFEKEKQVQNEVENGDHIPAWKQAVRSRKESFEKEKKQMQNEVVTAKSTGYINKEPSTKSVEKKGIAHNLRGKFEQQSTTQTFKKSEEKPVESEDRKQFPDTKETASQKEEESSKPQSEMEDERTNKIPTETPVVLQKLKGQFEQNEGSGRSRRPSQIKQAQSVFDVDDEKLKTMPKWKQDLILRKQQQQKTTETPPSPVSKTTPQRVSPITDHKKIKSDVAAKENNQSPVAKSPPVSVTKSSSPVSQNAFTYASSHTEMDKLEVVNSSDKKEDSPMLLHKEGKELKPPAFKIKGKWAEIAEDDPEFKNLPAWKQNLILRRKNDFKNRTALPKVEKEEKPKQEPLPAPLWTPTRSVTIREIPKGPEKTEDTNPLLDMRKNLKKVKKPISQTDVTIVPGRKNRKGDSPFGVQLGNRNEEEESLSPLKDNSNKPKRVCYKWL